MNERMLQNIPTSPLLIIVTLAFFIGIYYLSRGLIKWITIKNEERRRDREKAIQLNLENNALADQVNLLKAENISLKKNNEDLLTKTKTLEEKAKNLNLAIAIIGLITSIMASKPLEKIVDHLFANDSVEKQQEKSKLELKVLNEKMGQFMAKQELCEKDLKICNKRKDESENECIRTKKKRLIQ